MTRDLREKLKTRTLFFNRTMVLYQIRNCIKLCGREGPENHFKEIAVTIELAKEFYNKTDADDVRRWNEVLIKALKGAR